MRIRYIELVFVTIMTATNHRDIPRTVLGPGLLNVRAN